MPPLVLAKLKLWNYVLTYLLPIAGYAPYRSSTLAETRRAWTLIRTPAAHCRNPGRGAKRPMGLPGNRVQHVRAAMHCYPETL